MGWLFKWIVIAVCIFLGIAKIAQADALDSWSTWVTAQPYTSKQVPPGVLVMRGAGTDTYYVMEVDPTTGAIPVSTTLSYDTNYGTPGASTLRTAAMLGVGSTAVSNSNPVPISDAGGSITVDGTVTANQGGAPWTISLPTGASTAAKQPALGVAGTASADVITVQGITSMTPLLVNGSGSTQPVSGTVSASNFPATADVNAGASGASTIRVSEASHAYSDSARKDYSSGSVTTAAWVEVITATAAAINILCITDQSGQIMELGTGTAASETRVFLIARGYSGCIPLRIAASTRVAIKAVSATASTGDLVLSGMN